MGEECQVADYFVVAGLPGQPEPLDDYTDRSHLKPNDSLPPITDITVIFPSLDEFCPKGWDVLLHTPTGLFADLNHGSLHSPEVYICFKRGRDKPPLVDIGVLYENKERILPDSEIVSETPTGKVANVNNSTTKTFLTYRRARPNMPANELVVTDICVIIASKGEKAPHAFCAIKKNLNKGVFGAEVYLCYKKSMNRANLISYKPEILYRYPTWDRPDWKLHANVPMFCLPMGASLEVWPRRASEPAPVFSTFVLTVSDASEKVYGSAVTFYESYPIEDLTEEQLTLLKKSLENDRTENSLSCENITDERPNSDEEGIDLEDSGTERFTISPKSHTVHVNKCICLLSHWPFFNTFAKFLSFLYKLSMSGPLTVPIERYISHFLENVPFPSPQRPSILVQLSVGERVLLSQPEDLPLPRSGAGFRDLLTNLGPEDTLLVLLLVLTEHKLLVHSLRPDVLTAVVEAISMIIFPFKWQCPYIPLCPLGLAEVLHAPLPFLIGVDSRFFDMYDPPSDVTCVDLDTNNITISEEKRHFNCKILPKRAARNLKYTLEELIKKCCDISELERTRSDDIDDSANIQFRKKEQKLHLEIQEAFLRFMATILKGYRSYLLPITKQPTVGTTDPNSLFDLQGFLKSRDRAHHKFFVMIMRTQMFIRFIEERSFVSDMDIGLAFFDECTEKVENEENCRLLELDESHKSERTVFIPPPEPTGLPPGQTYEYQGFTLDNNLFRHKETKHTLHVAAQENTPGSPMARRTKHEVKSAQKLARRKHSQSAQSWAKCLLTTCYSLWFIHLPSFVESDPSKSSYCLKIAYDLLVKIQKLKLHPTDEVCYRVMMQLCGVHSQPVLAVNLLSQMRTCGIQPNALTYGYYNRAVLEATWPSDGPNSSHLWSKLRNVIVGAALFRRGIQKGNRQKLPEADSCSSIVSLDKGDLVSDFEKFDRERSRLGSIVKPCPKNLQDLVSNQPLESSAGILMAGLKKSPPLAKRRSSCSDFTSRLQQSSKSVANDVSTSRLRRGSMSPTLPELNNLKVLIRSDSFASDTSILEKHNRAYKPSDQLKPTSTVAKTLFAPRESSESLDNTDDCSLDDSCSSRRDSIRQDSLRNSRQDTPTRKLLSRLTKLGSDVWNKGQWRTSQDSVESVPAYGSVQSTLNTPTTNLNERNGGKPPWKSSEGLLTSDISNDQGSEGRNQRSASESRQGITREDRKSIDNIFKLFNSKTPSNSLLNSTDVLNLSSTSSQAELSCDEEQEVPKSLNVANGGCSTSEGNDLTSPSKISPVRTPVTKNDPLGAFLLDEDVIEENERTITNLVDAKNVLNSYNQFSEDRTAKNQYDLSSVGLFSNYSGGPKGDSDSSYSISKANCRKRDSIKHGHGDSCSTVGNRVPKSATFHNPKDKESKPKPVQRGSVIQEQDVANARKSMQRSTTMPDTAAAAAIVSSPSATVISHLSSFKFSFSRYSPSRFSLKKSDLRIAKTQILENAISGSKKSNELLISGLNTFKSAATSVAKKIEEAISTNTTPVKSSNQSHEYEDDEIETTVERGSALDFELPWGSNLKEIFGDGSRKGSSANLQPHGFEEQSVSEEIIMDSLYGKNATCWNSDGPVALNVVMTTCCKCNNCSSVLYDEEIIAGWTPEDSNLNTKCHFCGKSSLPFLSVTIYDYRGRDRNAKSSTELSSIPHTFLSRHLNTTSTNSLTANGGSVSDLKSATKNKMATETCENSNTPNYINRPSDNGDPTEKSEEESKDLEEEKCDDNVAIDQSELNLPSVNNRASEVTCSKDKIGEQNFEPYVIEPINVPYLNPLVLRKELENILHNEGDPSLTKPSFVDQHPIIYWNMVWVFERINVTSHLPGLALGSAAINKQQFIHPSWESQYDNSKVSIKCLWDNPRLHEEVGQPMYMLWQQQDQQQSSLVSALVTDRTTLPKSVMQNVITSVKCAKLYEPMKQLVKEREKLRSKGFSHSHSLYRDILYLAVVSCERRNINLDFFDREYNSAYGKLKAEGVFLQKCDKPPVSASYRNYFRPLLL